MEIVYYCYPVLNHCYGLGCSVRSTSYASYCETDAFAGQEYGLLAFYFSCLEFCARHLFCNPYGSPGRSSEQTIDRRETTTSLVCKVRGPVRTSDLPAARARKMIIWSYASCEYMDGGRNTERTYL